MSDNSEFVNNKLLCRALLVLNDESECKLLLDDLLTPKEIEEISNRIICAKMLSEKKIYSEIVEATGLSTATISRINKCLKNEIGGYNIVIKRLSEKEKLK